MTQNKFQDAAVAMIERRGRAAMDLAKQEILNTDYDNGIIASALKYHVQVNLPLVLPIFPALISLCYDLVKTDTSSKVNVNSVASAMVLIALSADIHDDVIDKSDVKYGKKTICGKFGQEIAILAGDALLIQGNTLLHQACEQLADTQRKEITCLVSEALYEISKAEALELKLRQRAIIKPSEYLEVMHSKGVVPEVQCRIGGILGQADKESLKSIVNFGRTVGVLAAIKDDFLDTFYFPEFKHRVKLECPPLPMIYAYQDPKTRKQVKELVDNPKFSSKDMPKVRELIMNSQGTQKFVRELEDKIALELKNPIIIKENGVGEDAALLLRVLYLN